ncbi:MAG: NlpC/P60 family protein [Flavisolibacter sp.]
MPYTLCLMAVAPMRKEASHRSEMVSQLLFGEFAEKLEETPDFEKVRCLADGYEGWVQKGQLTTAKEVLQPTGYAANWVNPVLINGIAVHVPFAAPLYESKALQSVSNVSVGEMPAKQLHVSRSFSEAEMRKIADRFLGTSYLWGGRSVFGVDCSGFVQQVFRQFGVSLQRDAYQQAEQGTVVETINDARAGDLAFFHNEAGRITHVGLVLSDGHIIHASVRVRIDVLDQKGIFVEETGVRSHRLHSIRRFF